MMIGFLDPEIVALGTFKACTKLYPKFAYAAYIDTLNAPCSALGKEDLARAQNNGLLWLQEKGAKVIVVDGLYVESVTELVSTLETVPVVIAIDQITDHLEKIEPADGEHPSSRLIHLTLHSEASDLAVAEILGGHFISEK